MRKYLLPIFITILQTSFGQDNEFVFTHLKEKDGLSNNAVNCIFKDSRGIVWIGTNNGLNRFDGTNFYVFKVKRNTNSLPDAGVTTLCEDKKGNIWGGTNNGIFCFTPSENRFVSYFPLDSRISNTILNILCDKDGAIWAAGWINLLKYNPAANKFENVVRISGYDSARQYSMRQNCLLMDPSGEGFWMATRTGMFYYNTKTKELLNYQNQPGNPLFNSNNVNSLAVSPSGHYWYYDNGTHAITAFDPVRKKILFTIGIEKYLPSALGATIYEDRQKRIWFCTWERGMLMVDYQKNKITRVDQKNADDLSIASGLAWTIFEDDDGTLWFGTLSGISRYNPDNSLFKVNRMPDQFEQVKDGQIYYLKEDPKDQSLWIMISDGSLVHWQRELNKFERYYLSESKPNSNGDIPGGIAYIHFFKNSLIACTDKGIWQLQRGTKHFEPLNILPSAYSDFNPKHFIVSGDSVFYLSDQKKILYMNVLSGKIKTIRFETDSLAPGFPMGAYMMVLDNTNKMWTYCGGGWIASIKDEKLVPVLVAKDEAGGSLGYFNSMEADDKGNIWLPNSISGLYAYNVHNGQTKYWDEGDGLSTYAPSMVMPDHLGQVWTVKNNKASVLLPGNRFHNFFIPLNENLSGYSNGMARLQNGNILISIYNVLIEFKAAQLNTRPAKKAPFISMVNVSGKDHLITEETRLALKPNENTLRFRFGILMDQETFPYELEYILDGAEKNWTRSEGKVEAVYNNLSPGSYTFRVKARGKNNNWESDETFLLITISTPFYKAPWFFLLIGLVALGIIVFIYRYRLKQKEKLMQLETKAQRLEKEKVMVMYESLKQQLNPHFLFNSLSSLSGLIEIDQQVAGNFLEQMSGIYRYILKNGENETVSLKEETEFVKLYINLQQTRFKKGLIIHINVPDQYLHYKIAPVTLQNMIENAIKHNIIDAGSPLVIDIFVEDEYLVVKNNLQKKKNVETSNKKGLTQFFTLYRYLSFKPVQVDETANSFSIKIPLI